MISSGTLPKDTQLFTSAFYSNRDQAPDSFYTFGYIDQALVQASGEDISWTPVDNSAGFWMVPSDSAVINGKPITESGATAVVDTGTTLLLVSDDVCDALYAAISGAHYDDQQQGYLIPNTVTVDDLPDFSVAIGGKQCTIQKEDLLFSPADADNYYGGVQSRGSLPFNLLGDVCLKNVYAVCVSTLSLGLPMMLMMAGTDLGPGKHPLRLGSQDREDAELDSGLKLSLSFGALCFDGYKTDVGRWGFSWQ